MLVQYLHHLLALFRIPQVPSSLNPSTKLWHSFLLLVFLMLIQQIAPHLIQHIDLFFSIVVVLVLFVPVYLRWSLLVGIFYWLSLQLQVESYNDIVRFIGLCIYETLVLSLFLFLKSRYLQKDNIRLTNLVVQVALVLGFAAVQLPVSYLVFNNGLVTSELTLLLYLVNTQLMLYTSVLLILCVTLLVRFARQDAGPFVKTEWAKMSIQISGIAFLTIVLYQLQPNIDYLMRMVYFIPLVWFGYRFGWVGVFVAVLCLILSLSIYLNSAAVSLVMDYQTFLVSYLLVSLLLGGMFIEQRIIEEDLYSAKHEVTLSNQVLKEKNNELQTLASDIIAIQEGERKALSQELHDEAAQNITALQIGIKLIEKKGTSEFQSHLLIVKNQATEIYNKVYELVHWLRPRMVDELGLVPTLESTYFADKLARANISYDTHITLDDAALTIDLKVALFRLIQEASLLAMDNRSVTKFTIHLSQHTQTVELVINDDREYTSSPPRGINLNLFKIECLVLALAGELQVNLERGMRLRIELPLHPLKGNSGADV